MQQLCQQYFQFRVDDCGMPRDHVGRKEPISKEKAHSLEGFHKPNNIPGFLVFNFGPLLISSKHWELIHIIPGL